MKTVQYYSLKDFFMDEDLNYLGIPDYQRAYSWESKQIEDLKEDIQHVVQMNGKSNIYQHFAGTIIINKNKSRTKYFDIVDGQQRITTLLVLLSVINASGITVANAIEGTYFGMRSDRKFVSNSIDREFFQNYVLNRNDMERYVSRSNALIKEAYLSFSEWINDENIDGEKVLDAVENNLKFIIYCAQSSEEIGLMFESINNRGRPLSEMDKVKNYLLYLTKKHDIRAAVETIKEGWRQISEELNSVKFRANENEDTILRNVVIAAYDSRSKRNQGETDYSIIKKHINLCDTSVEDIDDEKCKEDLYGQIKYFVDFLKHSCLAFAKLRRASNSKSKNETRKFRTYLNCHDSIAPVLPLYFAISEKASEEKSAALFSLIEKLNFRVYGLPGVTKRSDSNQSILFRWAQAVFKEGVDCKVEYRADDKDSSTDEDIRLSLKDALIRFTVDRCSQKKILLHLTIDDDETNEDYYRWNNIKYFLSRYEEFLRHKDKKVERFNVYKPFQISGTKTRSNEKYSIEHFWAKAYEISTIKKIPIHIRSQQLRRLGNLVLFPRGVNSSIKKRSPRKKLDYLADPEQNSNLNMLQQMNELDEVYKSAFGRINPKETRRKDVGFYTDLFKTLNDMRESRMLYAALYIWRFEEEIVDTTIFDCVDSIKTKDKNCHILPAIS